ncbi:SF1B family DNA helicase RecD2 [Pectinatus sottacetonis]|uniref:SF1B family DNA helicase RecD2 n=1 Tax=Pectinatus sottacetonis TaxID=1002795 RepID=UPI0018C51E41|nr:ATP-dependent RecD-like DNA helicase [Pectinatus sottacetonis]
MEKIEGSVQTIIFASSDGNFSVFRLKPEQQNTPVTVTANLAAPLIGQNVYVEGMWVKHPRFGQQFKAEKMHVSAPDSAAGIENFLASGALDGIGSATAKRIVNKFGKDTLKIIETEHNRLCEIPGIGKKTAEKIFSSYNEQGELRDIMVWLETHGVSGTYAGRIFEEYGSFAMDVIANDPYRLASDIDGIGFLTADQIAEKIGIEKNSSSRISAGIDFTLQKIASNGHCCVPEEFVINKTAKLLNIDRESVRINVKAELQADRLYTEYVGGSQLLYPPYLYFAEKQVAQRLLKLKGSVDQLIQADGYKIIAQWEASKKMRLAEKQKEAVRAVLEHGVLVLTGGPGTGKTTVVQAIIALLENLNLKILLGAPTGRAAKRLAEATERKAATIHRLLEATGIRKANDESVFGKDSDEPLDADVIIIDEVSMVDIVLMQHFLNAIPDGCRVVLVGDMDQLPAVGPGAVLKDILRSKTIYSIKLDEIFRQAQESMIVYNAHAINAGRMPDCTSSNDFVFYEIDNDEETAAKIVKLCKEKLPAEGFNPLLDVQVLSPMHRLPCGVSNLNRLLQKSLNPPAPYKKEYKTAAQLFRVGDKVMQIRNNYEKNVFNGDIGFIKNIFPEKIVVRFNEENIDYQAAEINQLILAYAMSVHKSQGSEYKIVILPLTQGHFIMLQRNLLYTAVTRAKERVIMLGSKKAVFTAVQNNKMQKRYTLLAERLAYQVN